MLNKQNQNARLWELAGRLLKMARDYRAHAKRLGFDSPLGHGSYMKASGLRTAASLMLVWLRERG